MPKRLKLLIYCLIAVTAWHGGLAAAPRHAIAMHGEPRHGPDFTAFDYVNPDAPKGGTLRLAERGSFDSLNPFIVRGVVPRGMREWVFESLLKRSNDEPFTLYGLLAQTVEIPPDRSWVEFTLNPRARFSDGSPVTVEDVIFSLETLRDKGRPNHRYYYSKVVRIERPTAGKVRFHFNPQEPDREMPLILGLMPILSKNWYATRDITATDLEPPVGSGPYKVSEVTPGRDITYVRNPDYWGNKLAVNRGLNNFQKIRITYFRDENSAFEAFKAGLVDLREEKQPGRWATGYDFPAARDGRVILENLPHGRPSGLRGLAFNTRRALFSDIRVRQAITHLFDFEWINKSFFHGAYRRTASYFDNSELSAGGQPPTEEERKLLARFSADMDQQVLEKGFRPPVSDGLGRNRNGLKKADRLLREAGWQIVDGRRTRVADGTRFSFELMLTRPENEKLALTFAQAAKRQGIDIAVRTVDSSQYEERLRTFDFDMILYDWYASLSPGNEQKYYWGSEAAETPGTRNYPGIKSAAVDRMIGHLLDARDRQAFVTAARALDRALMGGYYAVPLYHLPVDQVARWKHIAHPVEMPLYGFDISAWWAAGGD